MKALKIVGGIVVLVIVGVVIFAMTFDIAKYKGTIEAQTKAATGRDITIGDIRMGISLTPTIVLTDVVLGNAPWGSRPQMMIVKKLEAKVELLPLLSNQVNITKIAVDGADMLLETNKAGQQNWVFQTAAPPQNAASAGEQQAVNVSAIDATNMKIAIKDAKADGDMDVAVKSVTLRITGAMQQMNISSMTIDGATVNRRDGQDVVTAAIGKLAMESSGPIMNMGFKKIDVADIKVSGKSAGQPIDAEVSKVSLDEKGAFEMAARYNGGDITAKGTLGIASMKKGDKAVPMKLALEGMGLKGDVDVVVDATATPPFAKGTINIPEVDLTKLAPPPAPASTGAAKPAAAPAPSSAPAPARTAAPASQSGGMFSTAPLPWDMLNTADADVKVTVGTVKLANGQSVTNVSLPIKLAKGHLVLNDASLDLLGGKVAGDVDANAANKTVAIKGTVKGLSAESLAKAYKVTDLITNGPLDVDVDVRGAGASPKAIVGTLNGSFLATMGESRIRTSAMGPAAAQILAAINPMGNKDPYAVARCGVTNFQLANGVANTVNGVAMVTDKMSFTASGKIDLAQERIDMIVKPDAKSLVGSGITKIVSQVKVSGPMTSPNIGIDAAGAVAGVAGLATGIAGGAAGAGGNILGGIAGGLFGGGAKTQAAGGTKPAAVAAPSGDICAVARAWGRKS